MEGSKAQFQKQNIKWNFLISHSPFFLLLLLHITLYVAHTMIEYNDQEAKKWKYINH